MTFKRYRNWSKSAIECYERGCVCDGCPTKDLMEQRCQMKKTVIELSRTLGVPKTDYNEIFPGISKNAEKIINAILDGGKTKDEILKASGINPQSFSHICSEIILFLETKGYIFPNTNRLSTLVKYLQNDPTLKPPQKQNLFIQKGENIMPEIYHDKDLNIEYYETYVKLIDAIKKGYTSVKAISKITGIKEPTVFYQTKMVLTLLNKKGLAISTNPKITKIKNLTDWVQSRLIDVNNNTETENAVQILPQKQEPEKIEITEKTEETQLPNEEISEAEQKVLNLLIEGYSYANVAKKLIISETTVKTHVNNIFTKRNFHSLQECICSEYKKEKEKLLQKIKELEEKPIAISFEGIKEKIILQIQKLQNKLAALEELEQEL